MDCFLAQNFLQPRVVERHFLDLRKKYGNVLAIDLVNKHGGEGRLSENFSSLMQHVVSDDVRYLHFDFHHICGHVHFERLSMLYDQIENFLVKNRCCKFLKGKEKLGVRTSLLKRSFCENNKLCGASRASIYTLSMRCLQKTEPVAMHCRKYLLLNEKSEKVEEQLGVVGTNCIDCLNHTNVTQETFCNRISDLSGVCNPVLHL
ncbi:hypothetical protein HYC85_005288 [Camellia sinensis]|uniref:SAC domain-containing protein n=1 Tax=Camellia sinensis TaxID=4442 RepID=A0A7J7HZ19_CAMSI|nr:hypothetical protein HYC85_005288 [Camellia sinensis]